MSSFSSAKDLSSARRGWGQEVLAVWRQMPSRWVLVGLLGAWVAAFHRLGNSTLGYTANPSQFGWRYWVFTRMGELPDGTFDLGAVLSADEVYAWFIPMRTLWLFGERLDGWVALPK